MSSRVGHLPNGRTYKINAPRNKVRVTQYAYGFGNVNLWYDAGYGTNTVINGQSVSFWPSKINNNSFIQTVAASQAIYTTPDTNFNNFPSLFCQANRVYNFQNEASYFSGYTIAIIARNNTVALQSSGLLCRLSVSAHISWGGTTSGGIGWVNNSAIPIAGSSTTINDINPHIAIFTQNGIIVDGNIEATSGLTTITYDRLFQPAASTAFRFNGYLAEMIFYNKTISNVEAIQLCDNINQKYAIY
jgi:hypothetical protein